MARPTTLPLSALDHIPADALVHVEAAFDQGGGPGSEGFSLPDTALDNLPPEDFSLPDAALNNMAATATGHLPDWFLL